jgi:hypothetical protein
MTWAEIPRNPSARALRQFSAGWLVCFGLLAAQQYRRGHHEVAIALLIAGVVFGVAGLVRPAVMRWVFVNWMVLAFPIGWAVSQVMLLLMFYLILTPVAVIFRISGRDALRRKRPDCPSYWVPKETPGDVRSYFRQY